MPVSRDISENVIETILGDETADAVIDRLNPRSLQEKPLPRRLTRQRNLSGAAWKRRRSILEEEGLSLKSVISGKESEDPAIFEGNIENFVGFARVPLGVIGPLRINGSCAQGDFYVPLATTEGALVASYDRGAMVVSRSGGVRALCLTERVSRAPGFAFADLVEAGRFIHWVVPRFDRFQEIARKTTRYGRMEELTVTLDGRNVYLNFGYTTGDAAGQNMVTIATEAVCRAIAEECPVRPRHWFIESNLAGDKKATALSYLTVRGKKVVAEVVIPRSVFIRTLHTTPDKVLEYWKMACMGAVQSGSFGVQGHYANGLAALFIACGQDPACVAEAAVGITQMDLTDDGGAYVSVTLPSLVVGTVGGGTALPTQRECLEMMGCAGEGKARKFAEVCAALVLAGEISIMGAMASGQFAQAHREYGRAGTRIDGC